MTEKMIKLYYGISSASSRLALSWFKNQNIKVNSRRISHISKKDLYHILSLTENGFSDILKSEKRSNDKVQAMMKEFQGMGFSEAVDYLVQHPEMIRVPVILDENKIFIGYHSDEIRQFIPSTYRRLELLENQK